MTEINNSWPGWETVKLIGRGSFGAVYEIQRDVFGDVEKAALKVITIPQNESDIDEMYSEGYDEESITSTFQNHLKSIVAEYSLMQKMDGCANVVNCKDIRYVQHDDGIGWDIYIRMELLSPLMKALPIDISEDTVIQIGKDICNALVLCKKHEIVHRDIKPQNIFVSPYGDYKLGDFGIAKTVEKTMGGTKIGTYKYMAPEVYNNQPYGSGADIYSLGLVLYWLLNERRMPFLPLPPEKLKAGMEESARNRRLSGEQLPPPAHGSEELKRIVLKACAYDSKDRYASAAEMLEDLSRLTPMGGQTAAAVVTAAAATTVAESEEKQPHNPEASAADNTAAQTAESAAADPIAQPIYAATEQTADVFDQESTEEITTPPSSAQLQEESVNLTSTKQKKRHSWIYWVALGAIVVIICIFLLLRGCASGKASEDPESTSPGTVEGSSLETEEKYPLQQNWSEWADELPDYATTDKYEIEEQVLYRSRQLETTSSTATNAMDGWELYDTKTAGGYGAWSQWGNQPVTGTNSNQVETRTMYRYRTKETSTGNTPSKSGWELYNTTYTNGDFGNWSGWQTDAVTGSDTRQVGTKTQYSFRDVSISQEYSAWSDWGGWSATKQATSDLQKEESRTTWSYYYFECPKCGAHMHGWGECYKWANGCGYKYSGDQRIFHQFYSRISWDNADLRDFHGTGKYFSYMPTGELVFKHNEGGTRMEYRYATRTLNDVKSYSAWSEYSDSAITASTTREVRTRVLYRYRDRQQIPTYHFVRWGAWSDWSTTAASESNNTQVETAIQYRYRDQVTTTTYYFKRWTDWTPYSTEAISASDTVEVNTKTQYRFKSK